MALRAAIAVEGWPESNSAFARDAAGNRIYFLKTQLRLIEEVLLIGVQGRVQGRFARAAARCRLPPTRKEKVKEKEKR
jgi:hypothetical protein